MMLQACLNGGRPGPATPRELAAAAAGAVRAGADSLHVHPRSFDGRESLAGDDVAAALRAIREACPEVTVGVSTGLWITGGDAARRAELVAGWALRPDFASVNLHEEGAADLVRALAATGVGIEAGVWSPAAADRLAGLTVLRVLVEIIETPASEAVAAADAILARLGAVSEHPGGELLLHGEEEACWPMIAHAGRLGLPTRIGLEDTVTLPDGTAAGDNATLVRHARQVWARAGAAPGHS